MPQDQNLKIKRRHNFIKWWSNNSHRVKAHVWLCHYSRDTVYKYAMPQSQFQEIAAITKRFFSSDYKRLGQSSAWKLYKLAHPLENERMRRIMASGAFLEAQNKIHQENRKADKNEQ